MDRISNKDLIVFVWKSFLFYSAGTTKFSSTLPVSHYGYCNNHVLIAHTESNILFYSGKVFNFKNCVSVISIQCCRERGNFAYFRKYLCWARENPTNFGKICTASWKSNMNVLLLWNIRRNGEAVKFPTCLLPLLYGFILCSLTFLDILKRN